ncbi:MAG: DUF21 domain-containing protein [Candidatus Omnitrophica bacterium]|nr:DUF21 domain-containing protein [Candidatus Omnitrophota bacterium]
MTYVLILILCLVLSAFFSGSEMAFVSSNKVKMRELADSGSVAAQKVMKLYRKTDELLTTILIGNNVVNVTATAVLTYVLHLYFHVNNEWLVTLVMAPIIIIFGEVVPKDYCRIQSHQFLLQWSWGLSFFLRLLRIPVWVVLRGVRFLVGIYPKATGKSIFVSEEEFRGLIEEGAKTGVLNLHEQQIINTILDFERIRVESVMTPLEQVPKVDIRATVGDVKNLVRQNKARMVLVYEEIPSLVVGMVYVFDLLFEEKDDQNLKDYLRSPIFVPKQTSVEKAFLTLQEKRQSYAVATESWGDVVGIVPIEQLVMI